MTTAKRMRESALAERAEANEYITKILGLLPDVPQEALPEIMSHLGIVLGQARASVRKRKEERGVPIGTDTRILSPEQMEEYRRRLNGHVD